MGHLADLAVLPSRADQRHGFAIFHPAADFRAALDVARLKRITAGHLLYQLRRALDHCIADHMRPRDDGPTLRIDGHPLADRFHVCNKLRRIEGQIHKKVYPYFVMNIPKRFKVIFALFVVTLAYSLIFRPWDHAAPAATDANISRSDADSPSCSARNITVIKTSAQTEYDEAKLTGIVTNHCTSAVGVQLKWTAYNSDGTIAFSNDFWPASTTNIPPNTNYAFEMMDTAPRGRWTYTVEPIATSVW